MKDVIYPGSFVEDSGLWWE